MAACRRALAPGGLYLATTAGAPGTAGASDELAVAQQVFGGVLVVADAAVARGRRRGNLVVVARDAPFTAREAEAVERAVRCLPLPVRTWRADDSALS